MQGSLGIGAAHGFLERGEDIIMLLPILIIPHGAALGQSLCLLQRDAAHAVFPGGRKKAQLHGVHCFAHIPAARQCNVFDNPLLECGFFPAFLHQKIKAPLYSPFHLLWLHRTEFKYRTPA